jgi:large subunit ribosomal protein L17
VQSLRDAGKEDEARQMAAVALAHWRQAGRYVRKTSVLRKLFEQLAPLYIGRDGGYTRIIRMNNRLGDNARTVLLELVGTEKTEKPKGAPKTEEAEASEKGGKGKKKSKSKASGKKAEEKAEKAEKPKKDAKAKTKSKSKAKSKTKSKAKSDDKADKKKSSKKD